MPPDPRHFCPGQFRCANFRPDKMFRIKSRAFRAILRHDIVQFRTSLDKLIHPCCHCCKRQLSRGGLLYVRMLRRAVHWDFREGVKEMINKIDTTSLLPRYAFELACKDNKVDMILTFLETAKATERSGNFFQQLMQYGFRDLALKFVSMPSFDIDNTDFSGLFQGTQSALHVSVKLEDVPMLKVLLERGAKMNIRREYSRDDLTPLEYACAKSHVESALWLLKHGASPDYYVEDETNRYRFIVVPNIKSPLQAMYLPHIFLEPSQLSVEERQRRNDTIINLLLQAGMDVTKEKWLEEVERPETIREETHRHLVAQSCSVPTLEITGLRFIKEHLRKLTGGTSIVHLVPRLPISDPLKKMILMDVIVPYISENS